ncbi:MAG: TIGR01459 family HAD-type hydrolase [Albidovulum sp.]|nr:TIGR01459 family HAD-type hydrolase [Albidovulum sp.]
MTEIISEFHEISDRYDAILCDLWGCLHDGCRPFLEAVSAMRSFSKGGGVVVLLTNSPRLHCAVARQLDQIGVPREIWNLIVSSGDAAQDALFAGRVGKKVIHIGPPINLKFFEPPEDSDAAEIERVSGAEAEGFVCTGLFDEESDKLDDYLPMLEKGARAGLKLLCVNPDIVVDRGEKRFYCAGAIARLYESIGGESLYFGKPHRQIYNLAAKRLEKLAPGISKDRTVCVGDGIATDILGAENQKLDCVFVSGGLAARETGTAHSPDPTKLARFLERHGVSPNYAIGRLR